MKLKREVIIGIGIGIALYISFNLYTAGLPRDPECIVKLHFNSHTTELKGQLSVYNGVHICAVYRKESIYESPTSDAIGDRDNQSQMP